MAAENDMPVVCTIVKGHHHIARLILQSRINELSADEEDELTQWLTADSRHRQLYDQLQDPAFLAAQLHTYRQAWEVMQQPVTDAEHQVAPFQPEVHL